jgi:uncharacterized protein YbjQ (UPF0145 family)
MALLRFLAVWSRGRVLALAFPLLGAAAVGADAVVGTELHFRRWMGPREGWVALTAPGGTVVGGV